MKNINVNNLRTALLLFCVIFALTSCSAVFDSAISGTVKDRSARETSSTQSGGIADAMVYAYEDKDAWEKAYNNWNENKNTVFSDLSVPSAKSTSDGSFSISSLRWKTNSPVYGKDADCRTIYLLVFHKDYGLIKVDGRKVQSDKSNNFGIVYCDKITASKNLVIKLKDVEDNSTTATGSDSTISDTSGFSFRYSYCDGYSADGTDNVFATVSSITNGQASITVKYKDDGSNPPTVTVYDIQTGDDWSYSGANSVQMTYSPSSKTYTSSSLYFTNDWNTVSVTVHLKDGATKDTITDPIYFAWEYNNGDGDTIKSDTVTTSTGTATISVKFRKGMTAAPCTLKLTKFDDGKGSNNDYWSWTESEEDASLRAADSSIELRLEDSDDTLSVDVYFRKNYLRLGSGLSGYVYTASAMASTGYGNINDNGKKIYLYSATTQIGPSATTRMEPATVEGGPTNNGKFEGLGRAEKILLTYDDTARPVSYVSNPITFTVKREATEVGTIELTSKDTDFSNFIFTV